MLEKLKYSLMIELSEIQNQFQKKMESENKDDWFNEDLLDKEAKLKYMIKRLEEFIESEIDWIEKIRWDDL